MFYPNAIVDMLDKSDLIQAVKRQPHNDTVWLVLHYHPALRAARVRQVLAQLHEGELRSLYIGATKGSEPPKIRLSWRNYAQPAWKDIRRLTH